MTNYSHKAIAGLEVKAMAKATTYEAKAKAKAWTSEAKAAIFWPRGQGLASRTTSLTKTRQ